MRQFWRGVLVGMALVGIPCWREISVNNAMLKTYERKLGIIHVNDPSPLPDRPDR